MGTIGFEGAGLAVFSRPNTKRDWPILLGHKKMCVGFRFWRVMFSQWELLSKMEWQEQWTCNG